MAESLFTRLLSIPRTHNALTEQDWSGQHLRGLVEAEISPYVAIDNGRFNYSGDDPRLRPKTALLLGLVLHELATNAAKYCAFSNETGRVALKAGADGEQVRHLEWAETDGPGVVVPDHEGFGTSLTQNAMRKEMGADVMVDYASDGIRWTLAVDDTEP